MSDDLQILQSDLRQATEELSKVREELRLAKGELDRASRARGNLLSLSQELRTPLNAIMGFSQLLKPSLREDDGSVEQILTAGRQMLALIDGIIPAESQNPEEPLELQRATETSVSAAVSILYVEDNLLNLRLVERILATRKGITFFFTQEGKMAVPLAREHRPALILLDLHLPDMHGLEVLRGLREDPLTMKVPVVVVSADATSSQIERLLTAGARNYLTKPFEIERFLCTIDEILAEHGRDVCRPSTVTTNRSA